MRWISALLKWRDHVAYQTLCRIDRLRRPKPLRFATIRCAMFPISASIAHRSLYVTELQSLRKWASFRCPGGCGRILRLQLTGAQSPRWTIKTDWLGQTTVKPSVRQLTTCGCHFWVRNGCIDWCADTPASVLARGRERHAAIDSVQDATEAQP